MKQAHFRLYALLCICTLLSSSASVPTQKPRSLPLAALTRDHPPQQTAQSQLAPIEPLLRATIQHWQSQDYELADQTASQALALSRQRGDKLREARAASLLGRVSFHLGRISESVSYFRQVLLSGEAAVIRTIPTNALIQVGGSLLITGRYEDALFCFQQGLQLARQRQDRVGEAILLGQLGGVYAETGDFAKAAQYLQVALPLAQALADKVAEAAILRKLVVAEKGRGALDAALQYGERSLALTPQPVRSMGGLELLYHLGTVHAALGQQQKAAQLFEQALELARELQKLQPEALILGNLAGVRLSSGDPVAALELASQAIVILQRGGGSKHFEAKFLATRAEAQRALGHKQEALVSYRQALQALEPARARSIPSEISRAGIVATRHQVFVGAIELLLRLAQAEEAFEVAEAYHARAFLDVLAEAGLDSMTESSPAQQAREDRLLEQIASIQKELWQPEATAEQQQHLKRQLAEAEKALEAFRLEQRRADPRYAGIKAPQPLSHNRIAAELLDAETALIEYVLGDRQSFAWVVFQGQISSVVLPPSKELAVAVADYRTASSSKVSSLTAAQAIAKLKTYSQQLYQQLFQPLEAHLQAARKLIIVPDGALAYLPFETLAGKPERSATDSPYLIERFAISYAPSASALAALRALKPNAAADAKGIIAFGDPVYGKTAGAGAVLSASQASRDAERGFDLRQLPYTRREVNEIAALFPAPERRVFLGAAAHEANVKSEKLSQYVHFAAHALVDEEYPARSGIVLSTDGDSKEDGALQMSEVMRLKLNAELVTLSACRTGLGKLLHGEGMIGLTRTFLYAGAESVVVSLWNVNDIATALLMKAFYRNLQQGLAKDDALRRAKLELLRGQQLAWRHPYYWAAFVLIGDPQ
jgi:CHAT domain-containing protein